jgi:uridine kinase
MSRENATKPFVIGVAGGTCSGKTTVAERLVEVIGSDNLSLIRQDAYYIDRTGQTIEVPVYDYPDHNRSKEVEVVRPTKIVVFEGILALIDPALRELFDLKIFVDTPADIRLTRRLQRDITDRGRTHDSVIAQYLATVRPSHEFFVEPSKRFADLIFPEGGQNDAAFDVLVARIREVLS